MEEDQNFNVKADMGLQEAHGKSVTFAQPLEGLDDNEVIFIKFDICFHY